MVQLSHRTLATLLSKSGNSCWNNYQISKNTKNAFARRIMNIISHKHWESLEKMNQVLIEKWEALQHARKKGKGKKIIEAERQYLSALQNLNSIVEAAVSPASRKST